MAISLIALKSPLCFHMIPVSLGNKRLNLLSFSYYQPVLACDHFYWDSDKFNNRVIFFTTNKMPISLKALDFPFHFHLIPVSLGNTGRNLLSFSECQPVWVKPLFVPVWVGLATHGATPSGFCKQLNLPNLEI